jgi:hypothetical protein
MEAGDAFGTVSWLRQLVACFSCWRPSFKPIPIHMGCILDRVGLECVCLKVLSFFPVNVTPPMLHIHLFIHSLITENSFQMLVLICQTMRCHISEAIRFHIHCCKNLSLPLSVHPLYCPLSSVQSWDSWVSIVTGLWPGRLRNCGPQFPAGPRDLTFTKHPNHFWVCSILFSGYQGVLSAAYNR